MINIIEKLLDENVRPQLALHNGDVEIISYQNQILKIRLLGQCSGCPSATLTTEELIKKEVTEALPEVTDVILVTGVSDELIRAAKELLQKRN